MQVGQLRIAGREPPPALELEGYGLDPEERRREGPQGVPGPGGGAGEGAGAIGERGDVLRHGPRRGSRHRRELEAGLRRIPWVCAGERVGNWGMDGFSLGRRFRVALVDHA